MPVRPADPASVAGKHFDVVVVGSGFGSGFFLHKALEKRSMKVLVVEWGPYRTPGRKLRSGRRQTCRRGGSRIGFRLGVLFAQGAREALDEGSRRRMGALSDA